MEEWKDVPLKLTRKIEQKLQDPPDVALGGLIPPPDVVLGTSMDREMSAEVPVSPTEAMQIPALIQDILQKARENGVVGADHPEIVASVARDEETGAIGLRVTVTGLNPDQAESLWRDHIEPMTRLFLHRSGAGES